LCAIQALYQHAQTQTQIHQILQEFIHTPITPDDVVETPVMDQDLFKTIITGVLDNTEAIDSIIDQYLDDKWRIERLPIVMHSLLRCGSFELLFEKTIPTPVILDQYIEISKYFFDNRDIAFINAILDNIAKASRQ
jgi:N utilization substance protein B